ncbi:MAG: type V CRISPR-associated protein C2c8 [Limnoraphis sp. WC205]|jgi:hypothetical protein|nr:type V CRISPR-associated protein C2c8 [Limnoraphis sp. WC205]
MPKKEDKEPVRVIEFKIHPDADFRDRFENWAYGLKKFWNFCLEQFEILDENTYYDKQSKTRVPCCKLPWSYRYVQEYHENLDAEIGQQYQKPKSKVSAPCSDLIAPESIPVIRDAPEARQYTLKKGETAEEFYQKHDWRRCVLTSVSIPSKGLNKKNEPYKWAKGWLGGIGYSQPPKVDYRSALIKNFPSPTSSDAGILNKSSTIEESNLPDNVKQAILNTPYKFRAGTLAMLCTSWQEYTKSRSGKNELGRGKPRYKPMREKVETIIHPNPNAGTSKPASKDSCRVEPGNILVLPSFGRVKVKGLSKRFRCPDGSIPRVKIVKILKRPSGWFVQLTATIPKSLKLFKTPIGAVGIDTGVKGDNFLTSDRFQVKTTRWYRELEAKISSLQQEIDAKKMHRVILWLNHPENSIDHAKDIFPGVAKDSLIAAMQCKTIKQLTELVSENKLSTSGLMQIKHYDSRNCKLDKCLLFDKLLSESSREKALSNRLKKIQEKSRRQRRSRDQKLSTWIARKYNVIRIEDGLQNLKGKSKSKVSEDNKSFERNAQNARAGMNKSVSDAAIGQFIELTEQKSEKWGRDFKRLKPSKEKAYSQRCPVCLENNTEQKKIQEHPDFNCPNCGFTHRDRDVIPGINMMIDEYMMETVTWEDLSKESRQAWRSREKWLSENARQGGCQNEVNSDKGSNARKSRRRKK